MISATTCVHGAFITLFDGLTMRLIPFSTIIVGDQPAVQGSASGLCRAGEAGTGRSVTSALQVLTGRNDLWGETKVCIRL